MCLIPKHPPVTATFSRWGCDIMTRDDIEGQDGFQVLVLASSPFRFLQCFPEEGGDLTAIDMWAVKARRSR